MSVPGPGEGMVVPSSSGTVCTRGVAEFERYAPASAFAEAGISGFAILPVSMGRVRRVNRAPYLVGIGRCIQVEVGKDGLAGAIDADRLRLT
jgi:hypothetical protein